MSCDVTAIEWYFEYYTMNYIVVYWDEKGVVSLILVYNRRLWTCEGLYCHVKT